jgi:polysaccharide pyruvyl transferase CsaB
MSEKVVLSGYYGFGNGGDEALLLSLLQMLPDSVEPVVLSQTPSQTSDRYEVRSCARMDPWGVKQCLSEARAFIWGGGSLLQDRTSWQSPLYYLSLMGWAQQFHLITLAWAQGIGPLQYFWSRGLSRRCLQACTAISVRDQSTHQLLNTWKIAHVMGSDPVWLLRGKSFDAQPQAREATIALVLRAHPQLTSSRFACLTQALQQVQAETHSTILLVPFQWQDPDHSPDVEIAYQIQKSFPKKSEILLLQDPRHLRQCFNGIRLVITMRYHGLVMAAAAGCRCFGLSYDPKVSGLLEALGMPGWDLEAIPMDPDLIYQQWLYCYEQGPYLSESQIAHWQDKARIHQQILSAYLG